MKIDFLNKRIIVTNTELKRSSKYGSKEFYEFLEITAQLPNFKIERQPMPPYRATSPSPTYAFMETYLSSSVDTAEDLNEFLLLRQTGRNYLEIKKWFVAKFPDAFSRLAA